ncbi:hypothetical protein B0H13DRAFT_2488494 [Mycena leptocephala]|nr:hypothetical protein B0H13DRAFT_2488494 [Mycena leptocephala]
MSVRVEADERTVGRTTFALKFLSRGKLEKCGRRRGNADIDIARESREVLTRRSNEDVLRRSEVVTRGPNPSHLAQSNPLIFGIIEWGSTFPQKPDNSELLATLQVARNRNNWAKNTPIPESDDTISWFGFSTSFTSMGAAMMAHDDPKSEPSVLVFKTAWAGPFRVNLVHAIPPEGETEVAWRLDDTPESSTMMVERNASEVTFKKTVLRSKSHRRGFINLVWVSGEEAIESESDDTEEASEEDESEQEEGNVNERKSEGD